MRKLTTIIVIALALIGMTSCDADIRGKLADMMGNLGNNVMGSDTSSVAAVTEGTKVDEGDIEPIEGKSTVSIGGVDIELDESDNVESILPGMENKDKDEVISSIGNALKNEASKNALVESMQEKPSPAVQTAASGTATVMKKAIEIIKNTYSSSLPKEVTEALGGIQESLSTISQKSEDVTQADVVTLQLVQSFVTSLNTEENKNAIKDGKIPDTVLTDANNLITVASALSPASKFDALKLDLGSLLSSFIGSSDSAPKALSRSGEANVADIWYEVDETTEIVTITIPEENKDQVFGIAKAVYSAISSVTGLDAKAFASSKSALAFHKSTYENYVNFVAKNIALGFEDGVADYKDVANYLNGNEFRSFRTYSGLMQYVVATVLSEGDNLVDALRNDNPLDEFELGDLNLVGLIKEIADRNPWLTNSKADKVLRLPARYGVFFDETEGIDFKPLTDKMTEIIHDNASLELALKTLQRMVVFVDLSSLPLGDVNLVSSIDGLLDWFESDLETN